MFATKSYGRHHHFPTVNIKLPAGQAGGLYNEFRRCSAQYTNTALLGFPLCLQRAFYYSKRSINGKTPGAVKGSRGLALHRIPGKKLSHRTGFHRSADTFYGFKDRDAGLLAGAFTDLVDFGVPGDNPVITW